MFNRSVMVRSFVRFDYFAKGPNGESVRRIVNPYAFVWGAYPNLSLSFVAPLVSVRRDGPGMSSPVTKTEFGDGRVFARYDLFRKNVPGGFTRLSPEVGVRIPTGTAFSTGSAAPIASLVSPGVEMFLTRRLVLEFSLPVPVGRDLNGNQLKPRVSVIGGFRWLF